MFPDISRDDIFRIETPHLWLRWLRAMDAAAVAAFAGLGEVARMTASIPHPYPPGEAERFVLHARGLTAAGDALILAATTKAKGRPLVGIVAAQAGPAHEIELGYAIAPPYAGRGFATEAVRAIVDASFGLTEARAVIADCRTVNPASRRVLEKAGFQYERTGPKDLPARGGLHPCDFFRRDRHVWAAERTPSRRLPGMAHQAPAHQAPARPNTERHDPQP